MARLLATFFVCVLATAEVSGEGTDVSPVQKVIQMLTGMLGQGKTEKHNEQVQFAAYKQFCGDATEEKQRSVTTATEKIEMLNADIQMVQTSAEEIARQVEQLDADMATWTADEKAATAIRDQERKEYLVAHKDYSETIDAVDRATQVLQAKDVNRAQASAAAATSLLATVLQAKGFDKVPEAQKVLTAFLSGGVGDDADPPEAYAYESRSGGIIDLLKKLKDKFIDQRSALEKEEMNKRHAYDMLAQDLATSVKNAEAARTSKVQSKAGDLQKEATMKGELEDTTTTKADDEKYLRDVTSTCTQKSADFEERQKLRADEIEALEKALEILGSDAVSASYAKHLGLVQSRTRSVAFVQASSEDQNPNQVRLAEYLTKKAEKINSRFLSALAVRVRDDPFSKVKKMIKDLITRLMEQATEESQHKGWCDTELAENEVVRSTRSASTERYHAEIDQKTSAIATLASEVTVLSGEVATLDQNVATQTEARQKEKATNEATIKDAQEAQVAVGQATTILREFYAQAGEATALVQKKHAQAPAAPEIFDGAYTGMQSQNGGIVGMLEVIQSDYARLESDTSAMEATSSADFDKSMSDSAVLKAQQQKDIEHKTRTKQTNEQALVDLKNDLSSAQKELDAAMNYYEKLKPSCLDAGTTYQERDSRRQEEIQSLQEAMRILNGEDIATGF